ncbi:hypothetical protein PVK06_043736 [Gossypium arboreum]|uniref:Uncharacterized protein n=1 Tax=Gossypium arboreum TaxID=29729 RepID=A0ABR0MP99_GOSAR|nr:hypothetical protein PVK06_043736 [Gossypium arboreum]
MELVDDDDVETMVALYCLPASIEPIELFAELANVEPVQNVTPLNQQCGVEDLYTNVPKASIHPLVIGTDADGEERSNNNGGSDHQGEDFSDLDLDKVSNDIEKEGADNNHNVYAPTLRNPTHGFVIQNVLDLVP